MTLEEVAIHHRINPNSLNTKDDALKIGIKSADKIAIIRTIIILQAVICNLFIIANIIKNW